MCIRDSVKAVYKDCTLKEFVLVELINEIKKEAVCKGRGMPTETEKSRRHQKVFSPVIISSTAVEMPKVSYDDWVHLQTWQSKESSSSS